MVSMESDSEVEITSYEKPFDQRTPIGLSSDEDDDDVIVAKHTNNRSKRSPAAVSSYLPAAYRTANSEDNGVKRSSYDLDKRRRDYGRRKEDDRHKRSRSKDKHTRTREYRRSRSRDRRRNSRDRHRRRSRSKDRHRRRSKSRDHHRRRSKSKDRIHRRSRSRERKSKNRPPEVVKPKLVIREELSPDTNRRNRRQRAPAGGCVFGGGASAHVMKIKKIKIKKEKLDPEEELKRLRAMITEPFVYKPIDIEIRQEPISDNDMDISE